MTRWPISRGGARSPRTPAPRRAVPPALRWSRGCHAKTTRGAGSRKSTRRSSRSPGSSRAGPGRSAFWRHHPADCAQRTTPGGLRPASPLGGAGPRAGRGPMVPSRAGRATCTGGDEEPRGRQDDRGEHCGPFRGEGVLPAPSDLIGRAEGLRRPSSTPRTTPRRGATTARRCTRPSSTGLLPHLDAAPVRRSRAGCRRS